MIRMIRWLRTESVDNCISWAQFFLMPIVLNMCIGGLVVLFAGLIIRNIWIGFGGVLLGIIGGLLGAVIDTHLGVK